MVICLAEGKAVIAIRCDAPFIGFILIRQMDLNNKRVACPLSAGINSAGVLCWLKESGMQPSELHIYYAHFSEHSPKSLEFVEALIEMAKAHFHKVITSITYNSVLTFFEEQKMIPHPKNSPCSRLLKIEPMMLYNATNLIDVDLIGYVRTEKGRIDSNKGKNDLFMSTAFPIAEFDDEWCFNIVKKHLGWYPEIYDLKWNDEGFCGWLEQILPTLDADTQHRIRKKMRKR